MRINLFLQFSQNLCILSINICTQWFPINQYAGQEPQEWHDCQPVKRFSFQRPHSIGQKMSPAIAPVRIIARANPTPVGRIAGG